MKTLLSLAITFPVVLLMGSSVFAQSRSNQPPPTERSAIRNDIRALGMGNAYIAHGRNANAFLYNPALLNQAQFDLAIPSIQFRINDNMLKVIDFVRNNADSLQQFTDLTPVGQEQIYDDITSFDNQFVRFGFSPMLNLSFKNFGLAGYNRTRFGVKVDKGIYEPRVFAEVLVDFVVAGGLAKKVNDNLALGGSLKIINRRETVVRVSASNFGDGGDILGEAADSLASSKTGMAIDLGAIYQLGDGKTQLAFVIQDIGGKVGEDDFPTNVRIGMARRMLLNRLTLALDVEDLLNQDSEAFFNRVHMGAELRLPLISLRGGFNQGYPTLGAGLSLWIIKFDYAFWGEELGHIPGQRRQLNHQFQIRFGPGW